MCLYMHMFYVFQSPSPRLAAHHTCISHPAQAADLQPLRLQLQINLDLGRSSPQVTPRGCLPMERRRSDSMCSDDPASRLTRALVGNTLRCPHTQTHTHTHGGRNTAPTTHTVSFMHVSAGMQKQRLRGLRVSPT